MTVLFALVFAVFGRPLYAAMGGSGAALDGAMSFAWVLFLGCGVHWLGNTLASILRGTGDMHSPGMALVTTAASDPAVRRADPGRLGIAGPPPPAVISYGVATLWILRPILQGRARSACAGRRTASAGPPSPTS
jgi:Na+-driven multidrug efflux pump